MPQDIPKGRAYLEGITVGNELGEKDIIFRCNGVCIENDRLISSCVHVNSQTLPADSKMIPLGGYKNLLVIKNARNYFEEIKTYPPHDHIGEDIKGILPVCSDKELQALLLQLIQEHQLWAWGEAVQTTIPSFYELHQQRGAMVCKTEIIAGIAKAMNMFCPSIEHTTADTDTNLVEKARVALQLSKEYDLTILHINGADEAAHRKNPMEKQAFMQRIEREVILFLQREIPQETALIVTSDHATDAKTGKHHNEPVNYYIFNRNKECEQWLKR